MVGSGFKTVLLSQTGPVPVAGGRSLHCEAKRTKSSDSKGHCLRGKDTRVLAGIQFWPQLFGALVAEEQRTEQYGQEPERNRDDARIFQREERLLEPEERPVLAGEGHEIFISFGY